MKIERINSDFGNSTNNLLFDSFYFEIPTCVAKISKNQAESIFTNTVDNVDDLLDRLLISTVIDDEECFFLVGKLAETNAYANSHVGQMHDKIQSNVPYAIFLASMAYYYKLQNPEGENVAEIEVDAMKMMLPIWLLKKEDKFSIAQNKMASRFQGEHTVSLLTSGMETELVIKVNAAKCYIESEVARWALKYKMTSNMDKKITLIEKRSEAKKFDNSETVLVDIGGGSTDAVLLAKGLNTPVSKDSFQVIQIEPFLGRLDKLIKDKLLQHFSGNLRGLESFIVNNYKNQKYILKNPNTGDKYDLTEQIVETLKEYAELLVFNVTETFNTASSKALKYIYVGGEAPILAPYIKETIKQKYSEEILDSSHYFLNELLDEDKTELFKPTSRTINLASLEILSLNERKSK